MLKWISGTVLTITVLIASHFIAQQFLPAALNQQNLYWIFSSSAQSIAAFVAFLLAGYTLFYSMMNEVAASDDSLIDIVDDERRSNFKRLRILLISTGLSLILNLLMIFLNDWEVSYKNDLIAVTFLSTAVTIVLGLSIVVFMIDPKRNAKVAKQLLQANPDYRQTTQAVSAESFFTGFVELERRARDFVEKKEVFIKTRLGQVAGFREIVNALYYSKRIDQQTRQRLLNLNSYRNLIFHGQITDVRETMVEEINALIKILSEQLEGF